MKAKRRKRSFWSRTITESGITVRLYRRAAAGPIYRSVVVNGQKDRRSLQTSDPAEAEERARAFAKQLTLLQRTGAPLHRLTLAELFAVYTYEAGSLLTEKRQRVIAGVGALLRKHLRDDFPVEDFGAHQLNTYVNARTSGLLRPDHRRAKASPRAGTIRDELQAFFTVCNWAAGFRPEGRPLLSFNPLRGLKLPREKKPLRPDITEADYKALLAVADQADPEGRLDTLLVLAWETGRRINAILHLRASDVLLTPDKIRGALADAGESASGQEDGDDGGADDWPQAIRWRAEWDKCDYLDIAPITGSARTALESYLRRHPVVGEGWLFPSNRDPSEALNKVLAGYYLSKAERLAGLPHTMGGGWHRFRRTWATRRKSFPLKDVMRAGGWRAVSALQTAYLKADSSTVLKVVEGA